MRDLDSYLAGLFDGEGCVSVQQRANVYGKASYSRLLVCVGMRTVEPLELLQQRFGGSLRRYGDMWQWFVGGSTAIDALTVFAELCVVKAEQARLALRLAELMRDKRVCGRRKIGESVITASELAEREAIAFRVTDLKRYA